MGSSSVEDIAEDPLTRYPETQSAVLPPPKSVHIVNQILKDFKDGKQDRARFWINMGGRMSYICYYAARDSRVNYLETLEVTQD